MSQKVVYELVNGRSNREGLKIDGNFRRRSAREAARNFDQSVAQGIAFVMPKSLVNQKFFLRTNLRTSLTCYPRTLIFENDSTAVPVVGRPIERAGWKVVKISRFLNCGITACASSGCERTR